MLNDTSLALVYYLCFLPWKEWGRSSLQDHEDTAQRKARRTDEIKQEIMATVELPIHPAKCYQGMKAEQTQSSGVRGMALSWTIEVILYVQAHHIGWVYFRPSDCK